MNRKQYLIIILIFTVVFSCKKEEIVKTPEEIIVGGKSAELQDSTLVLFNHHFTGFGAESDGIAWDEESGIMRLSKKTATDSGYHFVKNSILTCDLDTTGILRRITQVDSTSDEYILYTEDASLDEFFSNLDVQLSTDPDSDMLESSITDHQQISDALADDNGVLHPYKIVGYDENGRVLETWSAYDPVPENLGSDITFNVNYDYSGLILYDYKKDNIETKFFVSKGNIKFRNTTTVNISIKTEWSGWYPETYINTFYCANKSNLSISTDLELTTTAGFSYGNSTPIPFKRLYSKRYCYMVGIVPVWITVQADLYRMVKVDATGRLTATTGLGYETTSCDFGVKYKHGHGWSEIKSFANKFEKKPLKVTGDATLDARVEIFPELQVKLYGVAGPYVELIPYLESKNDFSFDYTVGGEKNTYWNSLFQTGVDAKLGAKVKVLGHKLAEYSSGNIHILKPVTIYHAPDKIEIYSGDAQTGIKGQTLGNNLSARVVDSWGNVVEFAPVYFEPITAEDGSAGTRLNITDKDGLCSTQWLLGSKNLQQSMKASIKKDKATTLSSVTFKATAN